MYVPEHFAETRLEELHRIIDEYPLGTLVVNGARGLDAHHLPFVLSTTAGQRDHLLAHVARANPIWNQVANGDEALVIFQGGDAYISPNWYPSKHESHKQVPTWNYRVVHVYGRVEILDDEKFVRGVVGRLTRTNEGRTNAARPWKMTDAPKDYLDQMLAAIVGVKVEITNVIGKWKLGQNREDRDRVNAAEELLKRNEQVISRAMLRARENATPPAATAAERD